LEMEFAGEVLVKAYERGEVAENQREMERAYEFGALL